MLEKTYCYECECEIQDDETIYETRDGYICEDCKDRYYTRCGDCDIYILDDDVIPVDGDRPVCNECADEFYHKCDHCDELYSSYNLAVDTGYVTLCNTCYEDHYFTCPGCDDVCNADDGEYVGRVFYCYHCARECQSDYILSYSHKPEPVFYGGNAGYGLEIEIDDGDNRRDAARDIDEAGDEHIYLKDDGSLSSRGMEIVTHPASLNYHVNNFPWTDICQTALSYGYRSHDTDTCGLHIHASRSLLGDTEMERELTIAKIILLVDRWYDTHIIKFARRGLSEMRRWADKPNADIQPEDDDNDAIHKSKKHASDRYRAINLTNYHTIEFRFFKGTLKRDTIIASIQWVDTIINYCKATPLKKLFNAIWDDIFGNTGHVELTNYLKQRNLYNLKEEV